MASLPATDSHFDFVEKPSEEFYCPITFDLLREPHLTPCCGNHLSPVAVTRLQGQPCPLCKEPNLKTVPDKFFKRKVYELKVHCPNKSLGCEWMGELGDLDRHLSQNSVEGECQFVTVGCPYSCGDDLQRCQLKGHKANDCPNRPFTCEYCSHEATYIEVTSEHFSVCEKYPVECPNKSLGCQWAGERHNLNQHLNENLEEGECQFVIVACPYGCGDDFQRCQLGEHQTICEKFPLECPNKCGEETIERQHLPKHLEEACPLQVIKCEFSYAGCEVECQRQHIQTHLDENMSVHLTKVSEQQKSQIQQQQNQIQQQQSQIQQQQSQIQQQQSQIDTLKATLNRVIGPKFGLPYDFVITDYANLKQEDYFWVSPPFLTHNEGHTVCLNVTANGDAEGHTCSVSVNQMQEPNGDQPFCGVITIQLLNQERDEGHWEGAITSLNDHITGINISERVVEQYVKNNCLKFRISNIVVNSN